jgi:hypothetical protein
LHNITQAILIQNTFPIADQSRCLVTPNGAMFLIGGYLPPLKSYIKNTFTLDEHRSLLVALQNMNTGRADHALIYFKDSIYAFGGEAMVKNSESLEIESLTSCEVYSIEKDEWSEIPPLSKPRQNFSVCTFNEKFFFVFGGKALKEGQAYANGPRAFDFMLTVEVYEMERKSWKTINYIGENQRLKVLSAGATQISSS